MSEEVSQGINGESLDDDGFGARAQLEMRLIALGWPGQSLGKDAKGGFQETSRPRNRVKGRVKGVASRGSCLRWKRCILIVVVALLLAPLLPLT